MLAVHSTLDCATVQAWASALLDGELPALQVDAIHEHYRGCTGCARFYQSLREQLVLHRWAEDQVFDLDALEVCDPKDIPDYAALAFRLRSADLETVGRLLYEILKAEFVYDYGDNIEVSEAPIADPRAERQRGVDLVEELRDWHDADEVGGVDLVDVERRLQPAGLEQDRLGELIEGMRVVERSVPALLHHAQYYQALAHYKVARLDDAIALFAQIAAQAGPALARQAEVTLVSVPVESDDPAASIEPIKAALRGDAFDALLWFNLAKAHFLVAGRQMTPAVQAALDEARARDSELVARQLKRPSERGMLAGG
jgi:hypothetical protein